MLLIKPDIKILTSEFAAPLHHTDCKLAKYVIYKLGATRRHVIYLIKDVPAKVASAIHIYK